MAKTKKIQKKQAKNKKKNVTKKPAPKKNVPQKKTKEVAQRPKRAVNTKENKKDNEKKPEKKNKKAEKVTTTRQIPPQKPKMVYTQSQYDEYKKIIGKYDEKYGVNQLKDMLKKNDQTCTGTKDELLKKIADGEVLGRIPRCGSCFGGRLSGLYTCPGYRDDTDFHNCNKKFQFSEITRLPWTN